MLQRDHKVFESAHVFLEEATKEIESLKKTLEDNERRVKVAEAKAEIDILLSSSELPGTAKQRIAKQFDGAEASSGGGKSLPGGNPKSGREIGW